MYVEMIISSFVSDKIEDLRAKTSSDLRTNIAGVTFVNVRIEYPKNIYLCDKTSYESISNTLFKTHCEKVRVVEPQQI